MILFAFSAWVAALQGLPAGCQLRTVVMVMVVVLLQLVVVMALVYGHALPRAVSASFLYLYVWQAS
jgi:hypothetical protein